jgi:hypothetical protein
MALPPRFGNGSPIPPCVLVHPKDAGQVRLPPTVVAAVLPEPVGEGLATISGNREGNYYRVSIFGLFGLLECTDTNSRIRAREEGGGSA